MTKASVEGSILIVDDNPTNIDVLKGLLLRRGHNILTAENGKNGIALVLEELPDVILLDINMPGMSGFEVCEQLKSIPLTHDIPVIFVSALEDTENVVRGFDVGAVDYITKPFKTREIVARVETHILMSHQKRRISNMYKRETQQQALIDAMRQQFISSATHDLKSPLAIISGYTEMLAIMPEVMSDEEAKEYIAAIRRGVHKMNAVIADMLDLIKFETSMTVKTTEEDIIKLLRESATDMKVRADDKGIIFKQNIPEISQVLRIARNQMVRVIDNLISNAIKYTLEGGEVTVSAEVTDTHVIISVSDTGLGIPEDKLTTIFLPFQRVRSQAHMKQEGTGLGLSIVKTIVEQHDGTIEVQSKLEEGSTFTIRFPKVKS